jgi:diacylglycerol kinase (ATP)
MTDRSKSKLQLKRGGKFSVLQRFASLNHALAGLLVLIEDQHNARVHVAAALIVVTLGLLTGLESIEWILVFVAIGLVFIAEAFNSALEYLADAAVPEYHELIRKAKDVSAAAVLMAAGLAVIIGVWAFIP